MYYSVFCHDRFIDIDVYGMSLAQD